MADMIKIRLKRSLVAQNPKNLKVARALGFRKNSQILEKPKNASVMGMIRKIRFMLDILSE